MRIRYLTKVAMAAGAVLVLFSGTAAAHGRHGGFQQPSPGAFGTVASVGGVTTAGTCGSGTSGSFTLTGYQSSTTWTVDVTSSTTFVDPAVSAPSFADVCVGEHAGALGTVDTSTDTVTASQVFVASVTTTPTPRGVFGTVTAIGGVSTAGTCGSGTSGTFTVATWHDTATWTVTVSSATTFSERGVSSPSFTDVCVGSVVGVAGTVSTSSQTVTATSVFIVPTSVSTPPPSGAAGKVASVGGVSTTGTCGSGTSGTFTLTGFQSSTTWTVDVSSSTTFVVPGVSSPSFANVCVGEWVAALGSVDTSTDTVTASKVFVAPVSTAPAPSGVFGTVTAVGGVSTSGTCGSGSSGTFTLETWHQSASWTVTVSSSTTYEDWGVSSPSFANVCVGSVAGVTGSVDSSTSTVTASRVVLARTTGWGRGGFSTHRRDARRR